MDDVKKIKICFISLDAYLLFNQNSKGIQGGAEVEFYILAMELAKDERFQVSFINGDFGQPRIEKVENITLYKASNKNFPFISLWKVLKSADADIYFREGASFVTDLVALFCWLHRKIFFFRTAHDLECDGTYLKQYPLRGRMYLWSLRHAKRVFVQNVKDIPLLLNSTGINASAIPNGHFIADPVNKNRDLILWVGRSEEFKQPQLFIQLAKEFSSEKFVMICQRTKGDVLYDKLIQLASSADNLKFIEFVPFHKIDYYFQHAKIFVNTSQSEGYPNTFIQAGKCATAIASFKVNPDNFLDKYNCGFCANGNWNTFVTLLKNALSNGRYIELGNNARKYVEQIHDIKKIIELYKKHFLETYNENPR